MYCFVYGLHLDECVEKTLLTFQLECQYCKMMTVTSLVFERAKSASSLSVSYEAGLRLLSPSRRPTKDKLLVKRINL